MYILDNYSVSDHTLWFPDRFFLCQYTHTPTPQLSFLPCSPDLSQPQPQSALWRFLCGQKLLLSSEQTSPLNSGCLRLHRGWLSFEQHLCGPRSQPESELCFHRPGNQHIFFCLLFHNWLCSLIDWSDTWGNNSLVPETTNEGHPQPIKIKTIFWISWSCCNKLKRIISPTLRILKDVDIRFLPRQSKQKMHQWPDPCYPWGCYDQYCFLLELGCSPNLNDLLCWQVLRLCFPGCSWYPPWPH